MWLDLAPLYSGTNASGDTLSFSYTFDANAMTEETEDVKENEERNILPLVFDGVTFPEPVSVTGKIVNRAGYLFLCETATLRYETQCARCLSDVRGEMTFSVQKPVSDDIGLSRLEDKDNDDYVQAVKGKLNLAAPVRDEILLSFPLRFLCREDCRGLCSGCGANLNTEPCRCKKKEIDPRFASLAALLSEMPDDDEDTAETENADAQP